MGTPQLKCLKIGIGPKPSSIPMVNFVQGTFTEAEQMQINQCVAHVKMLLQEGLR